MKCFEMTDESRIKNHIHQLRLSLAEHSNGLGLAANQIGMTGSCCLIGSAADHIVMVNPVIIERKGGVSSCDDGCLSIPGMYRKTFRDRKVKVTYQNENGEEITKWFKGREGQIVQHEIDHLNGILFIDRLKEQKNFGPLEEKELDALVNKQLKREI